MHYAAVDERIEMEFAGTRCPVCNGMLDLVDKETVEDEVPEKVLKENDRFWKCTDCGKVYWPGGHWEKIIETFEKYKDLEA
mgnify:CR=1 FL=1